MKTLEALRSMNEAESKDAKFPLALVKKYLLKEHKIRITKASDEELTGVIHTDILEGQGLGIWFEFPMQFKVRIYESPENPGAWLLFDWDIDWKYTTGGSNGNSNSDFMLLVYKNKISVVNRRDRLVKQLFPNG